MSDPARVGAPGGVIRDLIEKWQQRAAEHRQAADAFDANGDFAGNAHAELKGARLITECALELATLAAVLAGHKEHDENELQAIAFSACLHTCQRSGDPRPDVFDWNCITCKRILEALRRAGGPLPVPQEPPRLLELATDEARRRHTHAVYGASNGHPDLGHVYTPDSDFDGFSECPQADCVLVRAVLASPQPDKETPVNETYGDHAQRIGEGPCLRCVGKAVVGPDVAAPQPPASTPRPTVELVETLIERIGAGIRLNLPMWEIRRSVHDILALPDPPSAIPPPPHTDEVEKMSEQPYLDGIIATYTYADGVKVQRCRHCLSPLRSGTDEPLVSVLESDLERVLCLLVEYVDCPEVWATTITRWERALGRTWKQINTEHRERTLKDSTPVAT